MSRWSRSTSMTTYSVILGSPPGGSIRAQEEHHIGDLFHRGVAPAGNRRLVTLLNRNCVAGCELFLEIVDHARVDRARTHGVHPDALTGNFARGRLGQSDHGVLRC